MRLPVSLNKGKVLQQDEDEVINKCAGMTSDLAGVTSRLKNTMCLVAAAYADSLDPPGTVGLLFKGWVIKKQTRFDL